MEPTLEMVWVDGLDPERFNGGLLIELLSIGWTSDAQTPGLVRVVLHGLEYNKWRPFLDPYVQILTG